MRRVRTLRGFKILWKLPLRPESVKPNEIGQVTPVIDQTMAAMINKNSRPFCETSAFQYSTRM